MLNNLSDKKIYWLAGLCACLVFISMLFDDYFFAKFLGSLATAVAVFVTMLGVLPLRAEFEKIERQLQGFVIPPLVDTADEDLKLVHEIRSYFGKIERGIEQWTEHLETILKVCKINDGISSNEQCLDGIKNCLERISKIDLASNCPNGDTEQCFEVLRKKLENYRVIIVLCYENPIGWLMTRIRFYKKLGTLNKVVLCIGEKNNIKAILAKENIEVDIIFSKKLNCRKIAHHIDKKLNGTLLAEG